MTTGTRGTIPIRDLSLFCGGVSHSHASFILLYVPVEYSSDLPMTVLPYSLYIVSEVKKNKPNQNQVTPVEIPTNYDVYRLIDPRVLRMTFR
jgi:hypothetical protein